MNRDVWLSVRSKCKDLLSVNDYDNFVELFNKGLFDKEGDEGRMSQWDNLLEKFYPKEEIGSSNHKDEANLCDDFERYSEVMRERVIAHHQLKAFSMYLKDKPDMSEAYHKFLVSIILFCMIYYCRDKNLTSSFCR